jgi:carboxyl-terminal processing protease
MTFKKAVASAFAITALLFFFLSPAQAQQFSKMDRDRDEEMLNVVADDVLKHYYDPNYHGVDLKAQFAAAKLRIKKANSNSMALGEIAAALDSLNDSHTFFLPPKYAFRNDFGWQYQMIGDRCFITEVRPGSDADVKGVKPGDQILAVNGYIPTRDTLWKMQYDFGVLRPQSGLRLDLQDPLGNKRTVGVAAAVHPIKRVMDLTLRDGGNDYFDIMRQNEQQSHDVRVRYADSGDALLVMKLPGFYFSESDVGMMFDKARKHNALIVDLRGNPGGSVDMLQHFAGGVLDKDVQIADRVGRKDRKPQIAKTSHRPFTGKVVVLIDSRSASAAELFARLMQIEKRGIVLGDRSSGHVMESRRYTEQFGVETAVFYGVSITDADLIMSDGKSLEHTGVTPDEVLLPSASDLATGRDPVLARAAELLGVKLSPEDAGKMFPFEWPPE